MNEKELSPEEWYEITKAKLHKEDEESLDIKNVNLMFNDRETIFKHTILIENTRRPLITVRGKTLTDDELKRLITNEENMFKLLGTEEEWAREFGCGNEPLQQILIDKHRHHLNGWIWQDGTIYGSYISSWKYPHLSDYLSLWAEVAERNPFLDMTVSYAWIDETPCACCNCRSHLEYPEDVDDDYYYEPGNGCTVETFECKKYLKLIEDGRQYIDKREIDGYDSEKLVVLSIGYSFPYWVAHNKAARMFTQITFRLHDGEVDVFCGEDAKNKFIEYDSKYADERMLPLNHLDIYNIPGKNYTKFSNKFIKECYEYAGISDEQYNSDIENGLLFLNDESETVITKDWIIQLWDKYNGFKD